MEYSDLASRYGQYSNSDLYILILDYRSGISIQLVFISSLTPVLQSEPETLHSNQSESVIIARHKTNFHAYSITLISLTAENDGRGCGRQCHCNSSNTATGTWS